MAIDLMLEMALSQAKFEAELNALIWGFVAEALHNPKKLKSFLPKKVKDTIPARGKKEVFQELLAKGPMGWWTRSGGKLYRCIREVTSFEHPSDPVVYEFKNAKDAKPLFVKFTTILNRWQYFTESEFPCF